MKSYYESINEFVEDVKNEVSLKETLLSLGIVKEEDFIRRDFIQCIFHDGDNDPSLQITDN